MDAISTIDRQLLAAIQDGLPFVPRPYAEVGKPLGLSEKDVLSRLGALLESGVISRFGLVLRHHELGYTANAMTVWDVPDAEVDAIAVRAAAHGFVTLCYVRRRHRPHWPYNLYCMVHGRDRNTVLEQIGELKKASGLQRYAGEVLFSCRRFKQYGARFNQPRKGAA